MNLQVNKVKAKKTFESEEQTGFKELNGNFHDGQLLRVGDIVGLRSGGPDLWYFAILRKSWSNIYSEPHVSLQWLLPNENIKGDNSQFFPTKYTPGTIDSLVSYVELIERNLNTLKILEGPVHTELVRSREVSFIMSGATYEDACRNRNSLKDWS